MERRKGLRRDEQRKRAKRKEKHVRDDTKNCTVYVLFFRIMKRNVVLYFPVSSQLVATKKKKYCVWVSHQKRKKTYPLFFFQFSLLGLLKLQLFWHCKRQVPVGERFGSGTHHNIVSRTTVTTAQRQIHTNCELHLRIQKRYRDPRAQEIFLQNCTQNGRVYFAQKLELETWIPSQH